jgi:hypothetical protein
LSVIYNFEKNTLQKLDISTQNILLLPSQLAAAAVAAAAAVST